MILHCQGYLRNSERGECSALHLHGGGSRVPLFLPYGLVCARLRVGRKRCVHFHSECILYTLLRSEPKARQYRVFATVRENAAEALWDVSSLHTPQHSALVASYQFHYYYHPNHVDVS